VNHVALFLTRLALTQCWRAFPRIPPARCFRLGASHALFATIFRSNFLVPDFVLTPAPTGERFRFGSSMLAGRAHIVSHAIHILYMVSAFPLRLSAAHGCRSNVAYAIMVSAAAECSRLAVAAVETAARAPH